MASRTLTEHNPTFKNGEVIYYCGDNAIFSLPLTREKSYRVINFDVDGWPVIFDDENELRAYPASIFISISQIRSTYFE